MVGRKPNGFFSGGNPSARAAAGAGALGRGCDWDSPSVFDPASLGGAVAGAAAVDSVRAGTFPAMGAMGAMGAVGEAAGEAGAGASREPPSARFRAGATASDSGSGLEGGGPSGICKSSSEKSGSGLWVGVPVTQGMSATGINSRPLSAMNDYISPQGGAKPPPSPPPSAKQAAQRVKVSTRVGAAPP